MSILKLLVQLVLEKSQQPTLFSGGTGDDGLLPQNDFRQKLFNESPFLCIQINAVNRGRACFDYPLPADAEIIEYESNSTLKAKCRGDAKALAAWRAECVAGRWSTTPMADGGKVVTDCKQEIWKTASSGGGGSSGGGETSPAGQTDATGKFNCLKLLHCLYGCVVNFMLSDRHG